MRVARDLVSVIELDVLNPFAGAPRVHQAVSRYVSIQLDYVRGEGHLEGRDVLFGAFVLRLTLALFNACRLRTDDGFVATDNPESQCRNRLRVPRLKRFALSPF